MYCVRPYQYDTKESVVIPVPGAITPCETTSVRRTSRRVCSERTLDACFLDILRSTKPAVNPGPMDGWAASCKHKYAALKDREVRLRTIRSASTLPLAQQQQQSRAHGRHCHQAFRSAAETAGPRHSELLLCVCVGSTSRRQRT
jgi:hypothetical protein